MNIDEIKEVIPNLNKWEIEDVLKAIAEKLFLEKNGTGYNGKEIVISTDTDISNGHLRIILNVKPIIIK